MRSQGAFGVMLLAAALLAAAAPGAVADSVGAPALRGNPDVRSHAFYVLDGDHESVLAARHEHTPVPIASITKLMTALVVLEAGQPMEETLTITRADVQGTVGSGSRLAPGARLSRGDMMHLALMSSENRAAHVLCRRYPGGFEACVQAMNDRAKSLGMTSARFVEPTGLSSRNVASPEDLAKLVLAAGQDPTIRLFSTDPHHTFQVNRQRLEFRNTNLLVDNPGWDVTVQKTGYISEAGRCLVMQAVIDGRDVVIVLLNSWGKLTRIADAKRIRDWMESQRLRSES
jgi:D-alanyl-D-alanine endopeptidase (penicillin-binding protein 7)